MKKRNLGFKYIYMYLYIYIYIYIWLWLWKLDLERKRKMNCWYWMNRRNPCGGEVDEVGSVCDGQLLPNVWGSFVQSLALQHDKPNVDIKTFLNEIHACACPGSSSMTMSNLEKCLFNLKFAAGESKGKVMWHDKKKKEKKLLKISKKKKYHSERECRSKDVCGKCSLSEKQSNPFLESEC